jgi:hypothetical protein
LATPQFAAAPLVELIQAQVDADWAELAGRCAVT